MRKGELSKIYLQVTQVSFSSENGYETDASSNHGTIVIDL